MVDSTASHHPSTSQRRLVTEQEFLALPVSMAKVELIDGEVSVAPAPSLLHQVILGRIAFALQRWADASDKPMFVGLSPLDVRFGEGRILQPDIFLVLDEVDVMQEGPLDRVPDLCVEILSSNRVYDRITKRYLYAQAGVEEYWLVEQHGPIERWHGPGLSSVIEIDDCLASPLLPGFELSLEELFRF